MAKAPAAVATTYEQWEYHVEDYDGVEGKSSQHLFKPTETKTLMDNLGAQGWELVHITENSNLIKFYFKRKKQ